MRPILLAVWTTAVCVACASHAGASDWGSGSPLPAADDSPRWRALFDRKTFDGWISCKFSTDRWRVEDGCLCYRARTRHDYGNLYYVESKVPADFEIELEWRVKRPGFTPPRLSYAWNPANDSRESSCANIGYVLPDGTLCLHTHPDVDRSYSPGGKESTSLAILDDYSAPVGAWNTSRLICYGPRIVVWLNGHKLYDMDWSQAEEGVHAATAIKTWTARSRAGLRLTLHTSGMTARANSNVSYRSIRLRGVDAATMAEIDVTDDLTKDAQAFDWKSHALFGRLHPPAEELTQGLALRPLSVCRPHDGMTNPGGTTNGNAICSSLWVLDESDLAALQTHGLPGAMYDAKYAVGGKGIYVQAWQTQSADQARRLRDALAKIAGRDGWTPKLDVDTWVLWTTRECVVSLSQWEDSPPEAWFALHRHVAGAIAEYEREAADASTGAATSPPPPSPPAP